MQTKLSSKHNELLENLVEIGVEDGDELFKCHIFLLENPTKLLVFTHFRCTLEKYVNEDTLECKNKNKNNSVNKQLFCGHLEYSITFDMF